jgi:2-oxoisovalerate dehydrogenase E2 component (dihydrolipoyl transacylase)
MYIFKLPDLGEGLYSSEIVSWFVKVGDTVTIGTPIVAVETAKALVDIPAPVDGVISELYKLAGDTVNIGEALLAFKITESVTVVGNIEQVSKVLAQDFLEDEPHNLSVITATPKARQLARHLSVNLDVVSGTGVNGIINSDDVRNYARAHMDIGFESLRGMRLSMYNNIMDARGPYHASIFDEIIVPESCDFTVHIMQALVRACQQEPALNAWFLSQTLMLKCFTEINLGLALDTPDGLIVPVIRDLASYSAAELREIINAYKIKALQRSFKPEDFKGASIVLSNIGRFAGKFATPIVIPPTVAILAVGRKYQSVVVADGVIVARALLPLSLTFDHRVVTGAEAARFLQGLY